MKPAIYWAALVRHIQIGHMYPSFHPSIHAGRQPCITYLFLDMHTIDVMLLYMHTYTLIGQHVCDQHVQVSEF